MPPLSPLVERRLLAGTAPATPRRERRARPLWRRAWVYGAAAAIVLVGPSVWAIGSWERAVPEPRAGGAVQWAVPAMVVRCRRPVRGAGSEPPAVSCWGFNGRGATEVPIE